MALELNRAFGKAEGVDQSITSQIAEPLYVPYDDAASNRAGELKRPAWISIDWTLRFFRMKCSCSKLPSLPCC